MGSTVEEPDTLMEPDTIAPALSPAAALSLAPELGPTLEAVLGVVAAPPPLLHAPNASPATTANAPTLFLVLITRWFPLAGRAFASPDAETSVLDVGTIETGRQRALFGPLRVG
ncbi:MAG: hypothetical protein ACJ77D_09410 [Chloroflexota bacterium]